MFFLLTIINLCQANDNSFSAGIGPYYGGLGIAYTYEPIVGLGIQAGGGFLGMALGVRWQPEWLSGGYSQVGLARTVGLEYAPNIAIGTKFGNSFIVDANIGLGAKLNGHYGLFFDAGIGLDF
jgi:hypothetical protein